MRRLPHASTVVEANPSHTPREPLANPSRTRRVRSNYHTEHHDFPDVPAFRLRALRDAAPAYYADDALSGCRDGWWETMRRTFEGREFYACSGVGSGSLPDEVDTGR